MHERVPFDATLPPRCYFYNAGTDELLDIRTKLPLGRETKELEGDGWVEFTSWFDRKAGELVARTAWSNAPLQSPSSLIALGLVKELAR